MPHPGRSETGIAGVTRHLQRLFRDSSVDSRNAFAASNAAGAAAHLRRLPRRAGRPLGQDVLHVVAEEQRSGHRVDRVRADAGRHGPAERRVAVPGSTRRRHRQPSARREDDDVADRVVSGRDAAQPGRRRGDAAVGREQLEFHRAGRHLHAADDRQPDAAQPVPPVRRPGVRNDDERESGRADRGARRVHQRRRAGRPAPHRTSFHADRHADVVAGAPHREGRPQHLPTGAGGGTTTTRTTGTFYFSSLADYAASRPYSFVQQIGNGHVAFSRRSSGSSCRTKSG